MSADMKKKLFVGFIFVFCFFFSTNSLFAYDTVLRIGVSLIPPLSDTDENGNIIGPIPEMTSMILDELGIRYKMTV